MFIISAAAGSSGNVIVTGYSTGIGGYYDYATIAYSGAGVPWWTNRYNGPGNSYDLAKALAVDSRGNVFVTGSSTTTNVYPSNDDYNYGDYATIAYSGAGLPLWTNRWDGPANRDDGASAVAVDGSGNVFVTGITRGNSSPLDYATIAYSGAGVLLWTNLYNGPGNNLDVVKALAVDSNGNVFVTGNSTGSGGSQGSATIKYSGTGVPLWTNRYDGPGSGIDLPRQSLAVGPSGSVYVTATLIGSSGGTDFATIKYISVPLLGIERDGSGGFFVRIQGVPETAYRLQRALSLAGTWSDTATNIVPVSGFIEYHDTSPLAGQAFYRAVEQ